MNPQPETEFAAFVGIDWADTKHDICMRTADIDKAEFAVLTHRSDAIEQWACSLRKRFQGRPVAVCLEIAKGPLVYALQKYDFLVLFPVNPATLAKYREAFTPSRAKADPTDAQIALEILLSHRDKLKALNPQSASMRTLERLVEQRRRLVGDRNRITNRLTAALKQYFPEVLDCFEGKDTLMFCDFLSHWPTPKRCETCPEGHAGGLLSQTSCTLRRAYRRASPCHEKCHAAHGGCCRRHAESPLSSSARRTAARGSPRHRALRC